MVNNFFINPNSSLSQEEQNFQGVPRNGNQQTFLPDIIEGIKNYDYSTQNFQNQNVENMRSPNVPALPNASQINTMSTGQLLNLKQKIMFYILPL